MNKKEKKTPANRKRPAPGVPIPNGHIIEGVSYTSKKGRWRLGTSIGVGGFGVIFTASDDCNHSVPQDAPLVVKIEPQDNGPLFTEFKAMQRLSRPEYISKWKTSHKLNFLGLPPLIGFGTVSYNGVNYRFIVMERYGEDIHKLFQDSGRQLPTQTICNIGIKVVDVLEYLHAQSYTHNDIKGANLLVNCGPGELTKVYLIDLGLARTYMISGKHMEYRNDRRFAHNGTRDFTCRDAHVGVTSRRGDLETLGYNLLLWEVGKLPWENETDDNKVHAEKNSAFSNLAAFLKKAYSAAPKAKSKPAKYLEEYFKFIAALKFEEEPNYERLRTILRSGLKEAKVSEKDSRLIFPCKVGAVGRTLPSTPKQRRRASNEENIEVDGGAGRRARKPRARAKSPAKKKKAPRRTLSHSPGWTPLQNRHQKELDDDAIKSSGEEDSDDMVLVDGDDSPVSESGHRPAVVPILTAAAMEVAARHAHMRAKYIKNTPRRDSSDFRKESDILERRIQAGVHPKVQSITRDTGRDSNTIAGCSPGLPIRARRGRPKKRLASEASDGSDRLDTDSDRDSDFSDDFESVMSDLGQPTSHMMAVIGKKSNEGSTASGSTRKGSKASSKLDLRECADIPTPAMLEFMQAHPDKVFKYPLDAVVKVGAGKKKDIKDRTPGVRSSPRLKSHK